MSEVSTVAEQTATLAGMARAGLSRMEETMRHVTQAAASINGKLGVLNEKATNINQVVTTITKVADQDPISSRSMRQSKREKAGEAGRGLCRSGDRNPATGRSDGSRDVRHCKDSRGDPIGRGCRLSWVWISSPKKSGRGMQDVQQVGNSFRKSSTRCRRSPRAARQ